MAVANRQTIQSNKAKAVHTVPAQAQKPQLKTVGKITAPPAKTQQVEGQKWTILKNVEVPTKKSFGGKRGMYNDLFTELEIGDCVEIPVEPDRTLLSKMNGLYNAAKRNKASITIRAHEHGENGKGGVLRMWFNGFFSETEATE